MPKAHIVLGHPNPESYNAHLARVAREELQRQGWEVSVTDLYAIGFDPREAACHYPGFDGGCAYNVQREQRKAAETARLPVDVENEIKLLEASDLLILQFPLWWYGAPAIVKGWFDRTFVYGKLYTSTMRHDRGLFKGKRAMLSVTCGGPRETFQYNGRNGDIDIVLWPLNFSLSYLGLTVLKPEVLYGVQAEMRPKPTGELAELVDANTAQFRRRLQNIGSSPVVRFNGWEDWEGGRLKDGVEGHSLVMRARAVIGN